MLSLFAMFILMHAHEARADQDLCALRPDLCAAEPATRPRPALTKPKTATCRPAGGAVSLAQADLPVCGQSATRAPAAVPASTLSMDFTSYMNANARNPALNRRIAGYQEAFKPTAKDATIDYAKAAAGGGVSEADVPTANNH